MLGLLGPNGAGKTTAVRILTTILPLEQGRASVLGIDVAKYPQSVRLRIGLAGQYAAVDEVLTGRENLRLVGALSHLPKRLAEERATELLERFGLTDAADRSLKTYSGGMRRRLDLAAALVHRPPVLFLDEPTTGLDPASRLGLWQVIEELVADGTTVLLTTQYLEEADRLADNIVVIDHGRVIAEGTATELKSRIGSTHVEVTVGRGDEARARCRARPTSAPPPRRRRRAASRSRCPTARATCWPRCARSTPPASTSRPSRCGSPRSTTCSSSSPATPPSDGAARSRTTVSEIAAEVSR